MTRDNVIAEAQRAAAYCALLAATAGQGVHEGTRAAFFDGLAIAVDSIDKAVSGCAEIMKVSHHDVLASIPKDLKAALLTLGIHNVRIDAKTMIAAETIQLIAHAAAVVVDKLRRAIEQVM